MKRKPLWNADNCGRRKRWGTTRLFALSAIAWRAIQVGPVINF